MASDPSQRGPFSKHPDPSRLSVGDDAAHAIGGRARSPADGAAVAQSRRMQLLELGYEDIPVLSSLFAETRSHPLLMASPTRFIDVAAIVACVQRLYASSSGLGAWRANTLDGRFIGLFSLLPVEGSGDVEVHVRLRPDAWGRWYAIEGTNLLCHQAFEVVGLSHLFGYCHPDYRRIRRILTRFGFRDLGACEHRQQIAHRYRLDASTWRERNAALAH
jgi:RimJ/RimL family protein N-acetyltransferase